MEVIKTIAVAVLQAIVTIGLWEWFGRDFVTWNGFGTPFRRKNRKPNAELSGKESRTGEKL